MRYRPLIAASIFDEQDPLSFHTHCHFEKGKAFLQMDIVVPNICPKKSSSIDSFSVDHTLTPLHNHKNPYSPKTLKQSHQNCDCRPVSYSCHDLIC